MPRIRTVKPEFWTDAKIAQLPKATALFFIAMWNFADDQGIISDDPKSLSLQIPIYRSQDINKMINALWKAGLIKRSQGDDRAMTGRSQGDGLVMISGWQHQKIDRPRVGKYNPNEIKWLTYSDNTKDIEHSTQGKDRIGKDRKVEDIFPATSKEVTDSKKIKPKNENNTELNRKIWQSYFDAYSQRYSVEPIRNATVNTQISKIGKRLGDDAVEVVAFFVSSNNSLYLQSLHQVGLCLMHAESLHTQWRRGRAITQNDVRSFEKNQAKFDAANSFSLGFDDERKLIE